MRLNLFQRVAFGGILPVALLLFAFVVALIGREQGLVAQEFNSKFQALTRDQVVALDTLLLNVARPVRRTAQLGSLQPDLPSPDYWQWLAGILDDNAEIYGTGITFWPANRGGTRKDLYALRGAFGNHHDGRYYYQDESYTYDGTDGSHAWFSVPQRLGRPVWSDPYFDEGSGNVWMVSYSVPFYRRDNQQFDGVAFTDLKLDTLAEKLAETGHFVGHFAVVNRKGQFVFHSDHKIAGKRVADWQVSARLKYLLGDGVVLAKGGERVIGWPGLGRAWLAKSDVVGTDWKLITVVEDSSVLAGMGTREIMTALIMLLGLIGATVIALLVTRRITQPLAELTRVVNAAAAGDWNAPLEYRGKDELGVLADAFRLMRMHITDRDRRLRDINQLLEVRVQERSQAAQAAERRLREITDSLPCTVFQLQRDADGVFRYSYISEGTERLFGTSSQRLMSRIENAFELIHPADQDGLLKIILTAADTLQDFAGEYRVIHARSGTMVDILTSAAFMGEVDGCLRWNGYHIDVSTQKQLEKALLEAKREADDANAAKGRFLASMSHELRTPMNAVIGLADLTLNTPLNQQQHDWLQKIHRAANSQLRLINDVLDFSKFEAGKMQFETFPFVLSHVLEGACELVADQALNKGLALRVHTQADLPEKLIGDPLRLNQVLLNLLSNAVKFTQAGSVELSVASLGRVGDAIHLRFTVSDTGIGIPPEAQEKLFKAFSQADASTSRRFGGTGLGLAICQEIVTQLGGAIHLERSSAHGSSFSFELRFGLPTDDANPFGDTLPVPTMPLTLPAAVEPEPLTRRRPAAPAASVPENIDRASAALLAEALSAIAAQLRQSDGDAVDAWGELTQQQPWLKETSEGDAAARAMSSYQFQRALIAVEQLLEKLREKLP